MNDIDSGKYIDLSSYPKHPNNNIINSNKPLSQSYHFGSSPNPTNRDFLYSGQLPSTNNNNNNNSSLQQFQYNSEWLDTPDNSPSKPGSNNNSNMSSTIITSKYETPLSKKATAIYITPTSEKVYDIVPSKNDSGLDINSTTASLSSSMISKRDIPTTIKISNWDIFWAMLNDIVGKDKMAKIGQYTLRLLIYYAGQVQTKLSDDVININIINSRYNDSSKKLELLKNFSKHPADFIKILVIFVSSTFKLRFQGMVNGLSTYRQFLRFGKTPFRIHDLAIKFNKNINYKENQLNVNYSGLFNRKTLGQLLSLYYGINDESLLLFKLKFFSNPTFKSIVARHESFAWYSETWFAMYNAIEKLSKLNQQEMDIKIQIQVRNKAKILSRQLLLNNNNNSNNKTAFDMSNSSNNDDLKLLNEIQFKKNNVYLDIYKNLSDLIFNSYTVFKMKLPFDTIQIWMGISASVLSTIKLYRETKKKLIEKELNK
ncbi:uncharacterized protein RJT21DRAFT_15173 [Scheffersomyces amazonensis]|uniref:uncharacterized protein n=1 Tax=Scheffersomyces amazonensis TaxID=1078765 RepID=UPI00315DFC51